MKKLIVIFASIFVVFGALFIVMMAGANFSFGSASAQSYDEEIMTETLTVESAEKNHNATSAESIAYAENESSETYYSGTQGDVTIQEPFINVNLHISTAEATVRLSNDGKTHIRYDARGTKSHFDIQVLDNSLYVDETVDNWFSFFNTEQAEIEIELPEKEYAEFISVLNSGSISTSDVTAQNFYSTTHSGKSEHTRLTARYIETDNMSGKTYINGTGEEVVTLYSQNGSGKTELENITPQEYTLNCTSGSILASALGGRGSADLTSGKIEMEFKSWNDSLDISVSSGKLTLQLPEDAGAVLDGYCTSGSVKCQLNGENHTYKDDIGGTVGGNNKQNVYISVFSGSVKLFNS